MEVIGMTQTLATEYTYKLQVEDLATRANVSLHQARSAIKAYRNVVKDILLKGQRVEIPQLASVYPSVRANANEVFKDIPTYEEQLAMALEHVTVSETQLKVLVDTYLNILRTKLAVGYEIRIAGVFLMTPEVQEDGTVQLNSRLSPSLEKPEQFTFLTENEEGEVGEEIILKEKIIFRLTVEEDIKLPTKLHQSVEDIKKGIHFLSEDMFV